MTTSSFDRRLADALNVRVSDETVQRLDEVVSDLVNLRPVRLRAWRIAGALAVLVIAVPLVAVTSAGIRHTEDPFGLNSAAAFQAEIDAAKEVVPLPAGATWPSYVDVQDPDGSYSRLGGRTQVEGVAFCLWVGSWVRAKNAGDTLTADAARTTLLKVPTWEMYTGAFATPEFRDVIDRIVAGVRANDPSTDGFRVASLAACPPDSRG